MNIYEKNYWGLYFEFLEAFGDWSHRGLSFSLCTHFYSLIHKDWKLDQRLLKHSYAEVGEEGALLQERFESYLPAYRPKNNPGKVVFYDKFLRIPYSSYRELLPLSDAVVLKPDIKNMRVQPIPGVVMKGMNQFAGEVEGIVRLHVKTFNRLAAKHKDHPLFGGQHFLSTMKKQIDKIIYFIEASERLIEQVDTSLFILGETNSIDSRVLALAARKIGIPTICLQHGAVVSSFGYLPKVATYQGVYGLYDQSFFENTGVNIEALPIIGHPRFDEMGTRKSISLSMLYKKAKTERRRKRVLLIDHHTEKQKTQQFIDLFLKKAPEVDLLIRVKKGVQAFRLYENQDRVHLVNRIHLYDLFAHVDAVISYESTVVLESLLSGKRTFVWKLDQPGLTKYFSQLPVTVYKNEGRLVQELLDFLRKGKTEDGLSEQVRRTFYIDKSQKSTLLLKALIQSVR